MAEPIAESPTIDAFIARWSASGAAERANYQLFLSELCRRFTGARVDRVREVLETLAALGAIREVEEGRYVA